MIDIIRSLLPENLPERLTSLLGNAGLSQALANFTDTNMYHTPPSAYDAQNAVTDNPNFSEFSDSSKSVFKFIRKNNEILHNSF